MIRTDAGWEWFPILKAIEAEQLQREAPLVERIAERQEAFVDALEEIVRLAATPSQTVQDVLGEDPAPQQPDVEELRGQLDEAWRELDDFREREKRAQEAKR